MKEIYRFHAEICRSIANPKRLEILDLLRDGEVSVSALAERMEINATNVSQQLAVLRSAGVVQKRMNGTTAYYRLMDDRVLKAYDLMTQVMEEQLALRSKALDQDGTPRRAATRGK
ncbi:MAG: winged helix-turn-helix transcriptional regulator [bacterium]|nr:winged helix-turn-helix transcriptional regulator [bacterium]